MIAQIGRYKRQIPELASNDLEIHYSQIKDPI